MCSLQRPAEMGSSGQQSGMRPVQNVARLCVWWCVGKRVEPERPFDCSHAQHQRWRCRRWLLPEAHIEFGTTIRLKRCGIVFVHRQNVGGTGPANSLFNFGVMISADGSQEFWHRRLALGRTVQKGQRHLWKDKSERQRWFMKGAERSM